jgi:hypothetical protein
VESEKKRQSVSQKEVKLRGNREYSKQKNVSCMKTLCLSYYLLCFLSTKLENKRAAEQVLPRSWGLGEVAQKMYTHVSKCKNDKITLKLKNK